MLVLTRKPGERIHIGDDIILNVVRVQGGRVRIGIEAPVHCRVLRAELAGTTPQSDSPRTFSTRPVPV